MRHSDAALLGVLLFLWSGCDKSSHPDSQDSGTTDTTDTSVTIPTTDTACPSRDTNLELGTGSEAFVALSEGDDLAMVRGPQGGFHVYGSLRGSGFDEGNAANPFDLANPRITFTLTVDGTAVASLAAQPRYLPADATTGAQQRLGELVVIGLGDPLAIDGSAADLSVTLTDSCGRTETDHRGVIVRYVPATY